MATLLPGGPIICMNLADPGVNQQAAIAAEQQSDTQLEFLKLLASDQDFDSDAAQDVAMFDNHQVELSDRLYANEPPRLHLKDTGEYDFEIERVTTQPSFAGRHLLLVSVRVAPIIGASSWYCWTELYMVDAEEITARFRMKKLVEATGIVLDEQGSFPSQDLVGRQFTADVVLQTGLTVDKYGQEEHCTALQFVNERRVRSFSEKLQQMSDADLYIAFQATEKDSVDHMARADEAMKRAKTIEDMIAARKLVVST